MADEVLKQPDKWVAHIFEKLLEVLGTLDLHQDVPDVFLVYAHDNSKLREDNPSLQADAGVAQRLIKWLQKVGARIYSDQTANG